jgi:hypothetical protein
MAVVHCGFYADCWVNHSVVCVWQHHGYGYTDSYAGSNEHSQARRFHCALA